MWRMQVRPTPVQPTLAVHRKVLLRVALPRPRKKVTTKKVTVVMAEAVRALEQRSCWAVPRRAAFQTVMVKKTKWVKTDQALAAPADSPEQVAAVDFLAAEVKAVVRPVRLREFARQTSRCGRRTTSRPPRPNVTLE